MLTSPVKYPQQWDCVMVQWCWWTLWRVCAHRSVHLSSRLWVVLQVWELFDHSKTCLFDLSKKAWLTPLKWHSEELFPVPYKNEQHGFGWKSRLGVECPVYQSHSRCHKSSLSLEHVHSLLHFLYIIITSFSDGLLKLCQICFQFSW